MKNLKIAFLVLVLFLAAPKLTFAAVQDFDSPVTYLAGDDPRGLTSGDFDGDGFSDLATANAVSSDISIMINNGDGTFQNGATYSSGGESYGMTNADLNNDGKLDLMVANFSNAQMAILLGNGDGTFQDKVTYAAGDGARIILPKDLSGDGNIDLVCTNVNANNMSVFIGNGDGTFQPKVDYATGESPRMAIGGDFNEDGKVDVIVTNSLTDDFSVFLGNGDGTFQAKTDISPGMGPRSIASADFNKDGNLDVVTANYWSDNISVLLGNGDGTFQSPENYSVALGNYINIGDFNEDDFDDIVMTGTDPIDTNKLLIIFFINNGDGTFTREKEIDFSSLYRIFWMVFADLNNDGYLDFASTHYDDTLNIWLKHVDKIGPLVSFSSEAPPDSSYVKGTINIPAYAIDDESGVKDLSLFESENLLENVPTDSYDFSVDTTTLTDGAHTFKVLSSDNKDNTSFVERSYTVDNTNPTVDSGIDTIANGQFTQNATANDTVGIATYQWSQQSGPGTITFGTSNAEDTTIEADQDGTYVARLTVTDNAGNSTYDEMTLVWDTTVPAITSHSTPTFSTNVSTTTSFSVSWNGTDETSGIAGYKLQYHPNTTAAWFTYKIDGQDWTTKKSAKFTIGKPGYTYYFRVMAKDGAGNLANWFTTKRTIIPYDNSSLTYSDNWKNATPVSGYKNTLKYSSVKDAYATFVFTGKLLTLIAPKASNRGIIDVYIRNKVNGVWSSYTKVKTIDLYSSTAKNRVPIGIRSWTSSTTHQVKFVATGKKNGNSTGSRVDIDGVAILK